MTRKKGLLITPEMIIKFTMIALFLLQVYSYLKADWVADNRVWTSVTRLYKYAYSNKIMEIANCFLLVLMIIASVFMTKHDKISWVYVYLLGAFAIVYSVEAILDIGITKALYSGNLPANYLLVFAFFLGRSKKIWDSVKSLIPFFAIAYVLLLAFEFVDSYSEYGWVIYQNSSMMAYFSHLFSLSLIYVYMCVSEGKRTLVVCAILIALIVGAVLIRSRSWVIQSIVVIAVVSLVMYRKKNRSFSALLKGIIVLVIIAVLCAVILNAFFKEFVDSLIDKGDQDTRSLQYIELLEQTEPYKWLFGQGMNATYTHKNYAGYAFIDNEIFYLSFHYGIFFTILYFIPYFATIFKCLKHRRTMSFGVFAALVIFLWVASVNGLSVFNRIHLDVKSLIMPLFVGHIYQTAVDSEKKRSKNEDTVYS